MMLRRHKKEDIKKVKVVKETKSDKKPSKKVGEK